MTSAPVMTAPTYPARPINGGPLPQALKYPKSGEWYYEPKYNGWRALVHVPTGTMFNRHGERLTIEREFAPAIEQLRQGFRPIEWIDCEALERRHGIGKGTLVVLDYLAEPRLAYHRLDNGLEVSRPVLSNYADRRQLLGFVAAFGKQVPLWKTLNQRMPDNSVFITMTYRADGAAQLWDLLQQCNAALGCEFYEGVVAKRADSTYPLQLRSPDTEFCGWIKHRWAF